VNVYGVQCLSQWCRDGWLVGREQGSQQAVVEFVERHALTVKEVEMIIPARGDADPWRATARVWTAITYLTARRRDARIYGTPIRDTYYNMLCLVDVQEADNYAISLSSRVNG
jgi:hypothetical protein